MTPSAMKVETDIYSKSYKNLLQFTGYICIHINRKWTKKLTKRLSESVALCNIYKVGRETVLSEQGHRK